MDRSAPYRTAPASRAEPELDRVPVMLRGGMLRAGMIVVTPTLLRFEPRLRSPREVPHADGLRGLALSRLIDLNHTTGTRRDTAARVIDAWTRICASKPYERGLATTPSQLLSGFCHYVDNSGDITNDTDYAIVLANDRLIAIAANSRAYDACFETTTEHEWPHYSGHQLCCALRWLPHSELAAATTRVLEERSSWARWFTRDQVRTRKIYGRWHHLGENEYDTVVLTPTADELALLQRWLG